MRPITIILYVNNAWSIFTSPGTCCAPGGRSEHQREEARTWGSQLFTLSTKLNWVKSDRIKSEGYEQRDIMNLKKKNIRRKKTLLVIAIEG